tara:strand:+ start:573 stop:677 length:105 start_codon:yes stop_codon:yes gene_type:complete
MLVVVEVELIVELQLLQVEMAVVELVQTVAQLIQ